MLSRHFNGAFIVPEIYDQKYQLDLQVIHPLLHRLMETSPPKMRKETWYQIVCLTQDNFVHDPFK